MDIPLRRAFTYILQGYVEVQGKAELRFCELALSPRLRMVERSAGGFVTSIIYLTDSVVVGQQSHEVLEPSFQVNEDGTVDVTSPDSPGVRWRWEKLTVARWKELFSGRIPDFSFLAEDMSRDEELQQFYRDHYVPRSWLEGFERVVIRAGSPV
jgi:hypothetical protein